MTRRHETSVSLPTDLLILLFSEMDINFLPPLLLVSHQYHDLLSERLFNQLRKARIQRSMMSLDKILQKFSDNSASPDSLLKLKKVFSTGSPNITELPRYFFALDAYIGAVLRDAVNHKGIPSLCEQLFSIYAAWTNYFNDFPDLQQEICAINDMEGATFEKTHKKPWEAQVYCSIKYFNASLHALTFYGNTAFECYLSTRGRIKIDEVSAFLVSGADINAQDKEGDTAWHKILRFPNFTQHEKTLLDLLNTYPPNLSIRNQRGETPLSCLRKQRRQWDSELVRTLERRGTDLGICAKSRIFSQPVCKSANHEVARHPVGIRQRY